MSLEYNKNLIPRAKILRSNMTKQEKHLWYDFLRCYPVRFQRQKTIGNYIVDFYCHAAKLVIELDGAQHFEKTAKEYDLYRTQALSGLSIEVLRFTNSDVDRHFSDVCFLIDQTVRKRIK